MSKHFRPFKPSKGTPSFTPLDHQLYWYQASSFVSGSLRKIYVPFSTPCFNIPFLPLTLTFV